LLKIAKFGNQVQIGQRRQNHSSKFEFIGKKASQNTIKSDQIQTGDTNQMEETVWSSAVALCWEAAVSAMQG
jgi:hypothetical protein